MISYCLEVDEEEGSLHHSQRNSQHGKGSVDEQQDPEEFAGDWTHVLLIGPDLKHEFLGSELIVFEEPAHADHLLPRHVLGEPEVRHYEQG